MFASAKQNRPEQAEPKAHPPSPQMGRSVSQVGQKVLDVCHVHALDNGKIRVDATGLLAGEFE